MYVKNLAELKKALKTKEPLIQVVDEKFKSKIIKSAMRKGRLYYYDGQQVLTSNDLNRSKHFGAIAESTIIMLAILSLFAILGIYALYREFNIKVIIDKDGNLIFETNKS